MLIFAVSRSFQTRTVFVVSKPGQILFLAIGEEARGFLVFIGWRGQDGMVAGGMEAQHDFGTRRMFDAQALAADGNATVGTDFVGRTDAPNVRPPRAGRNGTQHGAFFF